VTTYLAVIGNHDRLIGIAVVVGALWLFATLAVLAFFKGAFDEEDAGYAAIREADPAPWADEPTPIYDALAAERVIASAVEVTAAEWKRQEGRP
jgi:hypothetical protein